MIDFTNAEREALQRELQDNCARELDVELGGFDAGFLLDFIVGRLGVRFYNKGLHDAQAIVAARADELTDAVLALEKDVSSV